MNLNNLTDLEVMQALQEGKTLRNDSLRYTITMEKGKVTCRNFDGSLAIGSPIFGIGHYLGVVASRIETVIKISLPRACTEHLKVGTLYYKSHSGSSVNPVTVVTPTKWDGDDGDMGALLSGRVYLTREDALEVSNFLTTLLAKINNILE